MHTTGINNVNRWFRAAAMWGLVLVAGCRSVQPRERMDWDSVLAQWRVERAAKANAGINRPDAPILSLPPPPQCLLWPR